MLSRHRHMLETLSKGVSNPVEGIKYIGESAVGRLRIRMEGNYRRPSTRFLVESDWDVLIILDACRYDSLNERNPFDAECQQRRSQASNTGPWFFKNFVQASDDTLQDIVYVSGNPKASSMNIDTDRFCEFREVFKRNIDSPYGTVPPEKVSDSALDAHSKRPSKRLVVHYVQPHGPFHGAHMPYLHENQYEKLRNNEVTVRDVKQAYHQCLDLVLGEVDRLVEHMNGDLVVTADHGEAFGESGIYGHPPWAHSRQLIDVPWIALSGKGKPHSVNYSQSERSAQAPSVDEQLKNLGYQ